MNKKYLYLLGIACVVAQMSFVVAMAAIPVVTHAQATQGDFNGEQPTEGEFNPIDTEVPPPMTDSTDSTCPPMSLCNPLKVESIQDLLYLIVNIATYIGVILGVLALIWVGFKFIAAQGNSDKLKEARGFFYAVVIGIAILISANAIVTILKNTLTTAGVVQPGVFGSQ